jgi:hypothetical protein
MKAAHATIKLSQPGTAVSPLTEKNPAYISGALCHHPLQIPSTTVPSTGTHTAYVTRLSNAAPKTAPADAGVTKAARRTLQLPLKTILEEYATVTASGKATLGGNASRKAPNFHTGTQAIAFTDRNLTNVPAANATQELEKDQGSAGAGILLHARTDRGTLKRPPEGKDAE